MHIHLLSARKGSKVTYSLSAPRTKLLPAAKQFSYGVWQKSFCIPTRSINVLLKNFSLFFFHEENFSHRQCRLISDDCVNDNHQLIHQKCLVIALAVHLISSIKALRVVQDQHLNICLWTAQEKYRKI